MDEVGSSKEDWLNRRESMGELRALAEAELVRRHDELAQLLNRSGPVRLASATVRQEYRSRMDAYLNERARRERHQQAEQMEALTRSLVEQGERMESLTGSINSLTVVIALATIAVGILTAWAVLSS
jgi:hypothetical protein